MFKCQEKLGPRSKWRDIPRTPKFATKEEAMDCLRSLDPDGIIMEGQFRVIEVE